MIGRLGQQADRPREQSPQLLQASYVPRAEHFHSGVQLCLDDGPSKSIALAPKTQRIEVFSGNRRSDPVAAVNQCQCSSTEIVQKHG